MSTLPIAVPGRKLTIPKFEPARWQRIACVSRSITTFMLIWRLLAASPHPSCGYGFRGWIPSAKPG